MIIENTDGTETFYREFGDPAHEAVVLLHGLGADHRMWQPQIQAFAGEGYFVLVPDLLGHGKSSKVKTLVLRDWENQVADLLRAKGIARCVLVGVSMGGVIAQSFVVHHPEKVSRMILSDTFGELKTFGEKMLGLVQVIGFHLYKFLGPNIFAKMMAAAYKPPFAQRAREYFSEVSLKADFDQLILARKAINKIDVIENLRTIDVPSLIMVGDQFGEWFIEINRKIAGAMPRSKFVVLENAMDPSNLVNPVDFNREVLKFLRGAA